ncbi:aldose 1-epimerase [Tamlana sp. 2201CG12-4]|uniref:aldose 1-epimerase n=1 Tax=Tamlana sp. 2201CG12-4 TaxID=3112582 RepID=UPI002DBACE5A|nr:aldose 1-epimerase [Tamlana sp. 2201CG12-4]MEC3907826.1 aldose 1-epimerase [Tamlana sp. 2201CG12-4]
MYQIKHHQDSNILEIENTSDKVYGKIYLNDGASLQELTLNGVPLIQDLSPLTYDTTFASSILFPFANRIKDGLYSFNGSNYQFETNQIEEHNALHGLVYNKTFQVIEQKSNQDSASITLEYIEKSESIGFPYTYTIQLQYVFTQNNLSLKLFVKNTDSKPFPFTLGWHPYFISDNLYDSSLSFDSSQKLEIGTRNITTGIKSIEPVKDLQIEDQKLDDCWVLKSGKIAFKTPRYNLIIDSSVTENMFLQAYTPPKLNAIAIEPTTGVSDSFNNEIGLQILNANDSYEITWGLNINNN